METWKLSLENLSLNRSVGTREPFSAAFICEINFESWKAPVKVIDPPALSGWWWGGNKRGLMGRWRSGHCGFFNLPDSSRWQRLITRWHGAVMFTLSHLFIEGWAGQGVCAPARWFNVTSPPSGQGVFESGGRYLRSWGHPLPHWGYYTVRANPGEPSSVYLLVVGGWAITHLQRGMGPYLSPSTGLPPLCCVQKKDFLLHYCVSYSSV